MERRRIPIYLENHEDGSHKYYFMQDNGDGTWTAGYGAIGRTPQLKDYPMDEWEEKLQEKARKGYIPACHEDF